MMIYIWYILPYISIAVCFRHVDMLQLRTILHLICYIGYYYISLYMQTITRQVCIMRITSIYLFFVSASISLCTASTCQFYFCIHACLWYAYSCLNTTCLTSLCYLFLYRLSHAILFLWSASNFMSIQLTIYLQYCTYLQYLCSSIYIYISIHSCLPIHLFWLISSIVFFRRPLLGGRKRSPSVYSYIRIYMYTCLIYVLYSCSICFSVYQHMANEFMFLHSSILSHKKPLPLWHCSCTQKRARRTSHAC